jgi:hypothetical protein
MLYAYVERFDVMGGRGNILRPRSAGIISRLKNTVG